MTQLRSKKVAEQKFLNGYVRGYRAGKNRSGRHSHEHDKNRQYSSRRRNRVPVSVTDRGDGHKSPPECIKDPGVHILVPAKLCQKNQGPA